MELIEEAKQRLRTAMARLLAIPPTRGSDEAREEAKSALEICTQDFEAAQAAAELMEGKRHPPPAEEKQAVSVSSSFKFPDRLSPFVADSTEVDSFFQDS